MINISNIYYMSLPIQVLTWNVCWGCMSSNDQSQFDITAKALALKCKELKEKENNICLKNVVELINAKDYDIIGLQEVVNWDEMIIKSPNNLGKMRYILNSIKIGNVNTNLITFINTTKFDILGVQCGNLDRTVYKEEYKAETNITPNLFFNVLILVFSNVHKIYKMSLN